MNDDDLGADADLVNELDSIIGTLIELHGYSGEDVRREVENAIENAEGA